MKANSIQILFALFVLILLLDCNNNPPLSAYNHEYILNLNKSKVKVEPVSIDLSEENKLAIKKAEEWRDIFPVEKIIHLEVTDHSVISSPSIVIRKNDRFFVYDHRQKMVCMFDLEGTFLGRVGQRGEGPGEFGFAYQMIDCGNQGIGIIANGSLYHYNYLGDFVRKFTLNLKEGYFQFTRSTIWTKKDQIIISGFLSEALFTPEHALFTYKNGEMDLVGGFGKRNQEFQRLIFHSNVVLPNYIVIGTRKRIWIAPPYETSFSIFDEHGRFGKKVIPPYPDRLTSEDFLAAANSKGFRNYLEKKVTTARMFAVGSLVVAVLVQKGAFACIYDENGTLLNARVRCYGPTMGKADGWRKRNRDAVVIPVGSTDHEIIQYVQPLDSLKSYEVVFDEEERRLLMEAGYDEGLADQQNPFLVIGRLKP